ncbi:MAG: hypothetical protein LBI72_06250 [Flavobacteriaceae bacterium]|jgi:hypothetical protein|nr:hypothetical protein [Flavobacteriaceae bacterium]
MKRLLLFVGALAFTNFATTACSSDDNSKPDVKPDDKNTELSFESSKGTYTGKKGNNGGFDIVLTGKEAAVQLQFVSDVVKDENLLDAVLTPKVYTVSDQGVLYSLSTDSYLKKGNAQFKFVSGELEVAKSGTTYTVKGLLTDEQKITYKIDYTGAIDIEPVYDTTYEVQNGWYWGDNEYDNPNIGEYMTYFTQGQANKYGELEGDGHHISLSFFDEMAPKAWEAKVPNKTFKASTEFKKGSFRVASKEAIDSGEADYSFASFTHKDSKAGIDKELYITDGSIKVMDNAKGQEIRFNIQMQDGSKHVGKYVGNVKQGDQYTISTLRADRTVGNLTQGFLEYKGKSPINGKVNNRWNIYLYNDKLIPYPEFYWAVEGSGEWMRVTIYTDVNATTDIPVGVYPIGEEQAGNAGKGGGTEPGLDWGTWFYELKNDEPVQFAPTRTGTVKIAKTGNTYTVTVDAVDDRENKIKATYTGDLKFENNANRMAPSQKTMTAKKSYGKGKLYDAAKKSKQ